MKLDNILTKEYLEQEYIFRKKTLRQIAFKNNCSVYPVRMRLIRYNIPRRQERNNPMFGKKHTLDARKKMPGLKT